MQEKAAARGPLVWRDMDQKALDDAYDQLIYAPNRDLVLARIAAASARARSALGAPQRIAYGPSEHEMLDIYRAPSPPSGGGAPINIFIHGGAWRVGSAADQCARRRTIRRRRRARRRARLHQCRSGRRRSVPDVPASQPRDRMGVAQRRKFRRRPQPALCLVALLRLAPFLLRAVARLARRGPAGRLLQRRAADQRHVRP